MAERRMFTKKVTDSDSFLMMPLSAQCLYFHLNMAADDDGFVNNPVAIRRKVGAAEDDMKLLIAKNFILTFDSGIIVIKHWKLHNYIQSDRYKPTGYVEEKSMLNVKINKEYSFKNDDLYPECIQDGDTDKVKLDKVKLDKVNNREEHKTDRFVPPTPDEVNAYCTEKGYKIDANRFCDFYESKDWFVGRNKMKNWKATVRTWNNRGDFKNQQGSKNNHQMMQRDYDFESLENEILEGGPNET